MKPETPEQMAEAIRGLFRNGGDHISFAEIMRAVGERGRGDLAWEILPNVILWADMSPLLIEALELLKAEMEPHPTSLLVYMADGSMLRLPIAKRPPRNGYREPHWAPVVFRLRRTRKGAACR